MENINSGWEFQKLYQTDIDKICNMDEISFDREAFEQVDLPHTWYSEENPYKGTAPKCLGKSICSTAKYSNIPSSLHK